MDRTPYTVIVHPFDSPTPGACAYERGDPASENALVYIGGLTSGPHVSNLRVLCRALAGSGLGYSVWEFRMRSSYGGFGYSSLANDVADMSALAGHLRRLGKKKIVFMGHSTGCQDCVEYTRPKHDAPPVEGYILLAPISDREAAAVFVPPEVIDRSVRAARDMIDSGREEEAMPAGSIPPIFATPVTAYRWHSLAAKG